MIPCSLGKRGCFLKPAVFGGSHSRNAPLLLSLKFLLQSEAVISLRQGRLSLHLTKHGAQIPLHIGPSGALRVELNNFTRTMMHALSQSKQRLTGGHHGEFEVLNLSAIQPDLKSESEHPKAPASASGACGRHGLFVTDQQACSRAAEPGAGQCDLHRMAQPCAARGNVFAPGGPTGYAGVQQLGGRLAQPCPGEPEGAQAGATLGTSGRCGRDLDEAEGQGVRALHEVSRLEEDQESDCRREQPPGSYVVVKEEDDKSSMSGYSLTSEFTHYNTRTGSRGRRLATPSPTGGPPKGPPPPKPMWPEQPQPMSTSTRRSGKHDAPERQHEIRPDFQQDEQQSYQQGCRRDGDQDQCREECHRDGKMAQQEIFTQAYHIIEPNAPICACRRGCKVELSATTQNPSRVFYKCSAVSRLSSADSSNGRPTASLDDKYLETRQRVVQGFPRTLTARESLVRILQDACPHFSKVGTGSNAFYKRSAAGFATNW